MKKYSVLGIISITTTTIGFIISFGSFLSQLILHDNYPTETNLMVSIGITAIIYLLIGLMSAIISVFFKKVKKTIPLVSLSLIVVLIGGIFLINYINKEPTNEEKVKKISEQIKQNPENDSLYLERITLYDSLDYPHNDSLRHSLIDFDLAKAYSLGCRSNRFYTTRAIRNFHPGKYEQAVADFSVLINRNEFKYYALRGFSYMSLRKYESAIDDFSEMMKYDPSQDCNIEISLCYKLLGKYQKALEYVQKPGIDKNLPIGQYLAISDCLVLLGSYNKVVDILNNVLQNDKNNKEAYQIRGMSYYKLKKYDKAINDLNNLLKLDTSSYVPQYFISVVYAAKGDKQNAIEHLHRAFIKGFGFTDILSQNAEFKKYKNDPQFIKICSDYSKNADTSNYYLNQVISRDYSKGYQEHQNLQSRIDILVYEKNMREEYNRLSQLLYFH